MGSCGKAFSRKSHTCSPFVNSQTSWSGYLIILAPRGSSGFFIGSIPRDTDRLSLKAPLILYARSQTEFSLPLRSIGKFGGRVKTLYFSPELGEG